jgi:hypothetical protein
MKISIFQYRFIWVILLIFPNLLLAQSDSINLQVSYLNKGDKPFDLNGTEKILTGSGLNEKLFLFGEMHTYKQHFEVAMRILQDLVQNDSVNTLIIEGSKSDEFFIKHYVETGEESISIVDTLNTLKLVYSTEIIRATKKGVKTYYSPIRKLYQDKHISIRSIDLEKKFKTSLNILSYIFNNSRKLASKGKAVNEIINNGPQGNVTSNEKLYVTVDSVVFNFEKDSSILKNELESAYPYCLDIINGLKSGLIYDKMEHSWGKYCEAQEFREKYMYNEILKLRRENPGIKLFGQFGIAHVCNYNINCFNGCCPWYSLADRLDSSGVSTFRILAYYPRKSKVYGNSTLISREVGKQLRKNEKIKFSAINFQSDQKPFRTKIKYIVICR